VDAYVEYERIVGNADGGTPFTDREYENFKKTVAVARRPENRLYVSYRCVPTGVDCKSVGPSSKCFCGHLFKHHATDNYKDRNVHCREPGCRCKLFNLIPGHGSRYIKCSCKHDYDDHSCTGKKKCIKCGCGGWDPTQSCPCGVPHREHETVYESYAEREADGRPVQGIAGSQGSGYAGLGAVTDFSSLVDGCDRLSLTAEQQAMRALPCGPQSGEGGDLALPGGDSSITTMAQSMAYANQVRQFYTDHNPGKIEDGTMERLLDQNRGREDQLLRKIKEKYGGMGGGGGGSKAKQPRPRAIREKPSWVGVDLPAAAEQPPPPHPEQDTWSGAFAPPPPPVSIREQVPFSHHGGRGPVVEEPMNEMDALHAKYDMKYGKPKPSRR